MTDSISTLKSDVEMLGSTSSAGSAGGHPEQGQGVVHPALAARQLGGQVGRAYAQLAQRQRVHEAAGVPQEHRRRQA